MNEWDVSSDVQSSQQKHFTSPKKKKKEKRENAHLGAEADARAATMGVAVADIIPVMHAR